MADLSSRAQACYEALEFGRRVRELEDAGQWEDRRALRIEWRKFTNSLPKEYRAGVIDAYYDEYCREPMEY